MRVPYRCDEGAMSGGLGGVNVPKIDSSDLSRT